MSDQQLCGWLGYRSGLFLATSQKNKQGMMLADEVLIGPLTLDFFFACDCQGQFSR